MPARERKKANPKPYHHGDLGNALVEAAVAAIEQHGVAELKMRDLTRKLGVSHGAPANHFKDRTDLLAAIGVQGFERLTARQRAALDRKLASPAEGLRAIGVAYVEFARDNPAYFEVMFQRGLLNHPALAQAAARCFAQLVEAIAALYPKQRAAQGEQRERELAALGSWAMMHGLATLQVQKLLPPDALADVAGLTQRVITAMTELAPHAQTSKPRRTRK